MKNFKGVVIEESLKNKEILKNLKIISTKVEKVTEAHKTPWLKQWTLHTVEIPEELIEKTAEELKNSLEKEHNWFMHFWKGDLLIVIFKDKIFKLPKNDKKTWRPAINYGISLGIPKYQLNFPTD